MSRLLPSVPLDDDLPAKITTARLSKSERPAELTFWIGHHRRLDRPPTWASKPQLKVYGASMVKWWRGLQPGWREGDKRGPMKRTMPADGSWERLSCPGTNGVFLVVLGAIWWFNAVQGKMTKELETLVDDVEWATSQMANAAKGEASSLGKRPNPPTVLKDKRDKKRARKS